MLGFLFRTSVKLVVLSVILYATFFIPVGERTLWEHLRRISNTREARELTSEVGNMMNRIKNEAGKISLGNPLKKVDN
jgi:hypothetical protein